MIVLAGGALFLISFIRAICSSDPLVWVRESNRAFLGLLLLSIVLLPEWGLFPVVLDALLIMVGFFILRAAVQAQGEADE